MNKECNYCVYFKREDDFFGRCRRFPPKVVVETWDYGKDSQLTDVFPAVNNDEWCGEWKPKEVKSTMRWRRYICA